MRISSQQARLVHMITKCTWELALVDWQTLASRAASTTAYNSGFVLETLFLRSNGLLSFVLSPVLSLKALYKYLRTFIPTFQGVQLLKFGGESERADYFLAKIAHGNHSIGPSFESLPLDMRNPNYVWCSMYTNVSMGSPTDLSSSALICIALQDLPVPLHPCVKIICIFRKCQSGRPLNLGSRATQMCFRNTCSLCKTPSR